MKSRRGSVQSDFGWLAEVEGQLIGDYVLDKYIDSGKIGFVYRAHLTDIPEIVRAVKLIPGLRHGWDVELKKVGKLSTVPNVVHFHHIGTDTVRTRKNSALVQYTVWDHISPGRSLRSLLKSPNPVTVSFLLAIVETVLRVLHACQIRQIPRHGDLHAGNILIGEADESHLDLNLQPIDPIYVSDFGYGATADGPSPKDDYHGLASIADELIKKVDRVTANSSDRQILSGLSLVLKKVLAEVTQSERTSPKQILEALKLVRSQAGRVKDSEWSPRREIDSQNLPAFSVGSYQVSEMLGDNWSLWRSLFVPNVPAGSRILERDITSVVTGPRGCGKTMLFRRLSERLVIECGPVSGAPAPFVGIYVNANDISDAFSVFPDSFTETASELFCFTHLCVLSDFLAVEAAFNRTKQLEPSPELIGLLERWLGQSEGGVPIVDSENRLERYREMLEEIKDSFINKRRNIVFPGRPHFEHHAWLKRMVPLLREACTWMGARVVLIFIDDYTTPRLPLSMQRILNRMFFQRSHEFVFKIATEAATTFLPEDFTGKVLQEGDDYRLVDLGEEALFMTDTERYTFLNQVFARRLTSDSRIALEERTLLGVLGNSGQSKTEFARLLRSEEAIVGQAGKAGSLRGATKRKALYFGQDVFCALWSGDTRIMIQLLQDVVDLVSSSDKLPVTQQVGEEDQDRAFRNRGSQWLDMQSRNQPSDPKQVKFLLGQNTTGGVNHLAGGSYGSHMKAVVEAFKEAARMELLGPVYAIKENGRPREVPKMAFRIEITDEFRLEGLEKEIYRDLIRYGLFMRDARGKSVRGAMVPRLYLRRLLLPYCVLALSKRDSVSLSCDWFRKLLLHPDNFMNEWRKHRLPALTANPDQKGLFDVPNGSSQTELDPAYDDLTNGI